MGIPLPPMSFSTDDLVPALEQIQTDGIDPNGSAALTQLIAVSSDDYDPLALARMPGMKFIDVVNDDGGTEHIQVFDPTKASEQVQASPYEDDEDGGDA